MTGFAALLRQRLRRDRVQLPLWVCGTGLMAYAGAAGVAESYGTLADRQDILVAVLANPVILMFRGLPSGTSAGAFLAFQVLPWLALLAALMSSFLAVRHTRADEESGRAELVAATPAGRTLPTAATIVHGVVWNALLAALSALALIGSGLGAAGSLISGAAAGATGVVFLGVGLVAAQLMRTARGANSLTIWVLVASFLIRGLGNAAGTPSDRLDRIQSSWLSWLSPFGWAEQTRPYDADDWRPLLLAIGCGLVLAVAAAALQSARDTGASLFVDGRGRADAHRALSSPTALVWRLASPSILGWAAGGAVTGVLATTLSGVVNQVTGKNPAVEQILRKIAGGGSVDQTVVTVFFTLLGILAACCAVQTVVRARQEEAHGTAELVLATPTGRVRWLAGHLVVAVCALLIVVAAAVAAGFAGIAGAGGDRSLYRVVAVAGAGQVAAALVFAVLTALAFVLLPQATIGLGWSLVLVATALGMFGPLFGFPDWSTRISPFAVTPIVTGDDVDQRGLWWLLAVAVVAGAAALALMRRRELAVDG